MKEDCQRKGKGQEIPKNDDKRNVNGDNKKCD